MKTILKSLGILLVLAGVACLVVYDMACPANSLLVTALCLEAAGIIGFALINRYIEA